MDREETDNLWQKVKAYEALLLQVIPQVDDHDQQAIQNALLLVLNLLLKHGKLHHSSKRSHLNWNALGRIPK